MQSEYLANHPILRTGDLDEARHCVAQNFCDHKLSMPRRSQRLRVRHNQITGRNLSLNYLSYDAEVEIDPGMLENFYLFQVPLNGSALVRHCGKEFVSSPLKATLLNPDREAYIHWRQGCQKLLLQIDKTFMEHVATEMLGVPAPGVIRFDPEVDLTVTSGRRLQSLVLESASQAESGALFSPDSTVRNLWAESNIVAAILSHQSSNISHIIKRNERVMLPKGVRKAYKYIHANLTESITLKDIARSANMNVRSLQIEFKVAFGLSPMRVLKNARLDSAAYQLRSSQHTLSVTDVAISCGFSHLGRFSQDFKKRFNYLPSQHLKNAYVGKSIV